MVFRGDTSHSRQCRRHDHERQHFRDRPFLGGALVKRTQDYAASTGYRCASRQDDVVNAAPYASQRAAMSSEAFKSRRLCRANGWATTSLVNFPSDSQGSDREK